MTTYSFIGSDKNAGKTTALNHIYQNMVARGGEMICVTSIGINGESVDSFDGRPKPKVRVYKESLFVSADRNLAGLSDMFITLHTFSPPVFSKTYLMGRAKQDFELVMEGPNSAGEISLLKERLKIHFPDATLLIDGSADRQFLGRPEISDGFYFSLLITDVEWQVNRARELLLPLSFPVVSEVELGMVEKSRKAGVKSLLLSETGRLIYEGRTIPFMDDELRATFLEKREAVKYVYLNGAFSRTLYSFFAPCKGVLIILDNFTLFQNIRSDGTLPFFPQIYLLNSLLVKEIFIKNETRKKPLFSTPRNIPVTNLFADRA